MKQQPPSSKLQLMAINAPATKTHHLLAALGVLLCLLLPSRPAAAQQPPLTLPEAVATNQVQVTIEGRNIAYVQPMLLLRLTNQTDQPLELQLQQGQQLLSSHKNYANVILSQTETVSLPPGETVSRTFYAYSLNANLAFPIPGIPLTIDTLATDPALLALLQRIHDHQAETTLAAQLAVWMQLATTTDFDSYVTRFGSTIDLQPQRQQTLQLLGETTGLVGNGRLTAVLIPLLLITITLLGLLLPRYLRKSFDGYYLTTHLATGVKYHIQQARQRGNPDLLAIKQPVDEATEARCLREIEIRGQIAPNAPHIVPLRAVGYYGGDKNNRPHPYLVEQYIEGADLSKVLTERPKLGSSLALEIIAQLSEALTHLHQQANVVHRELKPSNILIDKRGQLWLTDFATAATPQQHEFSQVKRGETSDIYWNAPELIQRKQALFYANGKQPTVDPIIQDRQVDIFSLGVLLCQLSSGKSPFVTQTSSTLFTPPTLRPDAFDELEPRLAVTVQQCLATDPASRFQSVLALQQALGLPLPAEVARRAQAELGRMVQDVMPTVKVS